MTFAYAPYISLDYLKPEHQGKTRESYELPGGIMAQVTTERVSTHNVVHLSTIPFKGEVLTMLTVFWLTEVLKDFPHHLLVYGRDIYKYLPAGLEEKYPELHYRTLIVKKLRMCPREFVHRRYLTGSLLTNYENGEDTYGLRLPAGLVEMSRFDELISTPTEKTETDDPVDSAETTALFPREVDLTGTSYLLVESFLESIGIALIDAKEEVGCDAFGNITLADELFTPDSSRFAWLKDIRAGFAPPWLDKQVVRDEAVRIWAGGPKVPLLFPEDKINETMVKYLSLLEYITGRPLYDWRKIFDQI
jgi:phosphoribosylaminoimidazole-succinocarboxamide synthase